MIRRLGYLHRTYLPLK